MSQSEERADLEIAPNDEQANCLPIVDFTSLLDGSVDRVESAMTLICHQLDTLIVRLSLTQPSMAMRMLLCVLTNSQ